MNILHALHTLLGQHSQAQTQNPVGASMNMQMHPQQGIPLGSPTGAEDSGFVNGPQGLVRQNADVAHFNVPGRGAPEDAFATPSQQGFTPLNADIAHFNLPSQLTSPYGFNPGFTPLQNSGGLGYRQNLQPTTQNMQNLRHANPQVRDNGFFYNQ